MTGCGSHEIHKSMVGHDYYMRQPMKMRLDRAGMQVRTEPLLSGDLYTVYR